MLNSEQIRNFYNDFTEYLIKDRIYPNARILQIFRSLDDIFKSHRVKSALEIGCGIGIISEHIRKSVPTVYAVDLSESNIRFASSTVNKVNFVCGDFLEVQLGQKFDLITLFDVLEHFPQSLHHKVFKRIQDYSKPSTLLAVTIPDADFLDCYRQHFPEKLQIVDESIHFEAFLSYLKPVDLEIMKFHRFGIDYENQYRYYLLNYRPAGFALKKRTLPKPSWIKLALSKAIIKAQIQFRKLKYAGYRQRLGDARRTTTSVVGVEQ